VNNFNAFWMYDVGTFVDELIFQFSFAFAGHLEEERLREWARKHEGNFIAAQISKWPDDSSGGV